MKNKNTKKTKKTKDSVPRRHEERYREEIRRARSRKALETLYTYIFPDTYFYIHNYIHYIHIHMENSVSYVLGP